MIKKLEGASIGEARRIIQNQFNDISSVFNVMDKSMKFLLTPIKIIETHDIIISNIFFNYKCNITTFFKNIFSFYCL